MSSLGGIPLDRRRPLASRDSIKAVVALVTKKAGILAPFFPIKQFFDPL
jgi:hypothetical protein